MPWPLGLPPRSPDLESACVTFEPWVVTFARLVTSAGVSLYTLPRIPGGPRVRPGGHLSRRPRLACPVPMPRAT